MTLKLDLDQDSHGYCIAWWDTEDDIEGDLRLGETLSSEDDGEIADHIYITTELRKIYPPDRIESEVFYWDSLSSARKALRHARALWKAFKEKKRGRPWPEWAIKAKAEGWVPAKGWKP
jgi:hypothetical protein